ncbi:recombinase family protein [Tsukamurella pseudospumae]|uniref:Resolvase n=1 Tax=Tsukamurella pseudospumae TaxID=239498 RepID=A0A138AW64_9ACTN|nr:recombinase family protein [Tsukamurella pseudospumae]KXP14701.1 resolvase [Tsukamurella pseudospumae]
MTTSTPHLVGYARVSTTHQDLTAQLDALTAAGVPESQVYSDKLSGSAGTSRPGLDALLAYVRAGDVIVVHGVDRLGRSVAEVSTTIAHLTERGVLIRSIREGIDTSTATGRMVASILASVAEMELELGRERRSAARDARRARGLPTGRPPALAPERQEQLRRLAATGEPVSELAAAFGVSRRTAFRIVSGK